jgi:hypothetical protein
VIATLQMVEHGAVRSRVHRITLRLPDEDRSPAAGDRTSHRMG